MEKEYCSYCMCEIKTDERYYKCRHCNNIFKTVKSKTRSFECPNCHRVVLQGASQGYCMKCRKECTFLTEKDIIISLIGPCDSGKTTYLASLMRELFDCNALAELKIVTSSSTSQNNILLLNELTANYRKKLCVSPTYLEITEPISIELSVAMGRKIKRVIVNIFDAAGEHYTDVDAMIDEHSILHNRITNSSAIIYCFAPNNFDTDYSRNAAFDTLENLSKCLRQTLQVNKNKKIKVPVAIVCTKLDCVSNYNKLIEMYSGIGSMISIDGKFEEKKSREISNMIKSTYNNVGTPLLSLIECNFENFQIFGTSAMANGDDCKQITRNYSPFRITDPFLWILYKLKFIK